MNEFEKRINLKFPLCELSRIVCDKYGLGEFVSNRLIKIGYEDFNYKLTTKSVDGNIKTYIVKIFSLARTDDDCVRLIERANIAYKNGIKTPKIYSQTQTENLIFKVSLHGQDFRLCVTDYISGKDFFSLGLELNDKELKAIARQVAKLNSINFKPQFVYDRWAIINFEKEYKQNISLVSEQYLNDINEVLSRFKSIDFDKLKKGFVHGDIITTNIIRDRIGELFIIDFSVSNYQPRIVDVAVCISDLCLDTSSLEITRKRTDIFLSEYQKVSKLSDYEKECLNIFIATHEAMTIIETTREKIIEHNTSKENDWFFNDSIKGLKIAKSFKFA